MEDPFALLIGFALDQRVPVPKAFMGPWVLRERFGGPSRIGVVQAVPARQHSTRSGENTMSGPGGGVA